MHSAFSALYFTLGTEMSPEAISFWEFMAHWGVWDIISLIIALIPSVLVVVFLFPRRAIDNFYVDTKLASVDEVYSRVIGVELRNHTNDPIYVLSRGFKFGSTVRPSPHGTKDAATGNYEIKFRVASKDSFLKSIRWSGLTKLSLLGYLWHLTRRTKL